jgi:hypothetical protein
MINRDNTNITMFISKTNRFRYKHFFYLFVLAVFFCSGCGEDDRRQGVIESRIKERVESFRTKKLLECRNQALDIATTNADSILLKNADLWQIKGDNIPRPPRPSKPGAPDITIKIDTTAAKPLF